MEEKKTAAKKSAAKRPAAKKPASPPRVAPAPAVVTRRKSVLFAASEAQPFIATGGLADVIGSLPKALAKNGEFDVRVVLPLYAEIGGAWREKMENLGHIYVPLAWRNQYCGVFRCALAGVTFYFIDNEYYFKRKGLYGFFDDGERFAFFSRAVLEIMPFLNFFPDVLHCHDWQTALSPVYLKAIYAARGEYAAVKTVFTIHNIEYQGRYGKDILEDVFGIDARKIGLLEYDGDLNLMKGAIECCDALSTVSPRYASEIRDPYYAHGLAPIIRANEYKLRGILNGIDPEFYDPATDRTLFVNYSAENARGKSANKRELQRLLGLPEREDVPLIAVVSRLVSHKGLDLVKCVIEDILREDVQFVVLGKGDAVYENFFSHVAIRYQGKCAAVIAYNPDLSRKIYAGADIFLMPSKTEPCGLSQMIASRYGAVPVVRETGGLFDSIKPYTGEAGNGFTFASYNAHDMLYVVKEAVRTYRDAPAWEALRRRAMTTDFSWNRRAEEYEDMYRSLAGE